MFEGEDDNVGVHLARSRRDEVLELIAKRRSLKQIAGELGIGESTVNYHIRCLKEAHGVNSLAQLADVHAARQSPRSQGDCRISARGESAIPETYPRMEGLLPDDGESLITFQDAMRYKFDAPWIAENEPMVVPEVLEGANASLFRVVVMVAIAVGILALVLLGLGVAQGISAAMASVDPSSVPPG
jgi:biotin operon repressor